MFPGKLAVFLVCIATAHAGRIDPQIVLNLPDPQPVKASVIEVQPKPVQRPYMVRWARSRFFGGGCFRRATELKAVAAAPDPLALLAAAYRDATAVEAWSLDTPLRAVPIVPAADGGIRFHRDREILGRYKFSDETQLASFFALAADATSLGEDETYAFELNFEQPSLPAMLSTLGFQPDLVFTFLGPTETRLEFDLRHKCVLVTCADKFGFYQLDEPAMRDVLEFLHQLECGNAPPASAPEPQGVVAPTR